MKAWVIRPKPHNINRIREFLSEQIVAIGWPDLGTFVGKNKEEIKAELANYHLDYSRNELNKALSTVNTFVNIIEIDDIVIVPDKDDIYFCRIISDYYYNQSKASPSDGYSHQRKIEWIKGPIKRKNIPDSLRSSMRSQLTLFKPNININDILEFLNVTSTTSQQISRIEKGYIEFDYPIRLNEKAYIRVPKNLTQTEASRLGDFVKTIYFNKK